MAQHAKQDRMLPTAKALWSLYSGKEKCEQKPAIMLTVCTTGKWIAGTSATHSPTPKISIPLHVGKVQEKRKKRERVKGMEKVYVYCSFYVYVYCKNKFNRTTI